MQLWKVSNDMKETQHIFSMVKYRFKLTKLYINKGDTMNPLDL